LMTSSVRVCAATVNSHAHAQFRSTMQLETAQATVRCLNRLDRSNMLPCTFSLVQLMWVNFALIHTTHCERIRLQHCTQLDKTHSVAHGIQYRS